ncbi:hypothetical protein FRAAL5136 [Frankia alni ACN14a]|uniref:Uncharacterized protein n=1 Tax=Frankia alni (strain DSM 45986 / CECT 9034 / ACN14a) TaxID=326424 RepID=Q0RFG7_FRAAA|nr:hypothetical protein FRAAL5136 [Frankia alni ACN14a]
MYRTRPDGPDVRSTSHVVPCPVEADVTGVEDILTRVSACAPVACGTEPAVRSADSPGSIGPWRR